MRARSHIAGMTLCERVTSVSPRWALANADKRTPQKKWPAWKSGKFRCGHRRTEKIKETYE
jgi:hypothetical protein